MDSKIYNELKSDDWDLLVAHYLGIDHAGHRYGPNHPEMARKLNETNSRLRKIIETLPPDALLYVVGDHGMTESGKYIYYIKDKNKYILHPIMVLNLLCLTKLI